MKVHFVGLEYGFGGVPTITLAVDGMVQSFSRQQAKDFEIAVGAILDGRQVVLSGKEIQMHGTCIDTSAVRVKELAKKLTKAEADLASLQAVVDKYIDTSAENSKALTELRKHSTSAKLNTLIVEQVMNTLYPSQGVKR